MDVLLRNWLLLIALSACTAVLAPLGTQAVVAAVLMGLALLKMRAILGGFLHLSQAPGWLGAFLWPLGLWMVAVWGFHALP